MTNVQMAETVLRTLKNAGKRNGGRIYSRLDSLINQDFQLLRFKTNGINCDLTFNNLHGLRNSELVSFLMEYDARFCQLVIFVREWARRYHVGGSKDLKSYAISLLVFIFLAKKKILPTLQRLQSMADVEEFKGWNVGFCKDARRIRRMMTNLRTVEETNYEHTVTFIQLTRDFFRMLATEDFEKDVICTLTAESFPKRHFYSNQALLALPEEYNRLKERPSLDGERFELRTFNVQDPFNLQSNPGRTISRALFPKLVLLFRKTAEHLTLKILENDSAMKVTVDSLFPSIEFLPNPTPSAGLNREGFGRIYKKMGSLPGKLFKAIEEKIKKDRNCGIIEMGMTEQFSNIFYTHYAELGKLWREAKPREDCNTLWCRFARCFIQRVWKDAYLLQQPKETILLDELKLELGRMEIEDEQSRTFCSIFTVCGQMMPVQDLSQIAYARGNIPAGVNPLDKQKEIMEIARKRYNLQNQGPNFVLEVLFILEIRQEDGPRLGVFITNGEVGGTAKQVAFLTGGLKRMFGKFQLYFLQKEIKNGVNNPF